MADLALVGRADELELARGLLRRATEGVPGVLLVGGEAGVGRSRLVAAVADEASAGGFRTAGGACVRMDAGALTYAAVVGALRALTTSLDPAVVASTLGVHRHQVARLLPEVVHGAAEPPASADDPMARLRLFEAVTAWLNRLAERERLLLVVEDLHWADTATLDLVRALARGLAGPTVLVVTLRTDETPTHAVQDTVAELVRGGAERVELAPLGRRDLARLAALARPGGLEPDDLAVDRLVERSGGNPFLALELIDAGLLEADAAIAVPRTLRDILDARLVALDGAVLDVLRAAALHPGPIDDGLVANVLGAPVRRVGSALREARDAGVLRSAGDALAFRHAIQRDLLVEQLGPGERRSLHGAFASALEGTRDPAQATAVAWHRDGAGDDAAALAAHVLAADTAMAASAFDAASRHAERAADLQSRVPDALAADVPDQAALLDRAALAALLGGDPVRSAELVRRALVAVGTDRERAAELHDRLRWALWEAGDRVGAGREVELAVAELGDAGAPGIRARLTAQRAAMLMDDADPGPALALADEAAREAVAAGARDAEALALGVRGRTLAVHGHVDEGLETLRRGIAIADELGNLQGRMIGVGTIAAILAGWGRSRDALVDIDATIAKADAAGLSRSLGAALLAQAARACLSIGDWDEAQRRATEGLARRPAPPVEVELRIVALRLAAAKGDATDAEALDTRIAVLAGSIGSPADAAALRVARAEAAIATGHPADVRPLVDAEVAALADGLEAGPSAAWMAALAAAAEVDLALGARARQAPADEDEAGARLGSIVALVRREVAVARPRWGRLADTLLAHVEAEASRLDQPTGPRVEAWATAVAAWDVIDRPYYAAYARSRLAEARLANGASRASVGEPLQEAASVARRLGAVPLLARIERLARMARVDLDAPGPDGAPTREAADPLETLGLTPREREILRLVAAGRSNAQIADALGITVSTASVHVSNILAKLDVENRVEAAALAHRLGVVGGEPDVAAPA